MSKPKKLKEAQWYVYMLKCADSTLYTGITVDPIRRVEEHNSDKKGAKYTRVRQPVALVYQKHAKNRSEASRVEAALKKLSRKEKLSLINMNPRQKEVL